VLGILDAEHEEAASETSTRFIRKLTCSLVGETQNINISPGTLSFQAYGEKKAREQFNCNYGLFSLLHSFFRSFLRALKCHIL